MKLESLAVSLRKDVVRMTGHARSGYISSALSVIDILLFLYEKVLRVYPEDPDRYDRDRLVMSKGHGCPALYAVLAYKGFFERDALWNFRSLGALLQGSPDSRRTPGVDVSSGAPGLGLGISNGIAMALKQDHLDSRVFCILGDGELLEGGLWESAMTSSHRSLDNLILVVDQNGDHPYDHVEKIKKINPVGDKFSAFGWNVITADGHDFNSLDRAFSRALENTGSPSVVIAKTTRGKGVSLFEGYSAMGDRISRMETEQALAELEGE